MINVVESCISVASGARDAICFIELMPRAKKQGEATSTSKAPSRARGRGHQAGKVLSDFPDVAAMLDPRRNGDLRPEHVKAGSRRALWWKCPKGRDHVWQAPVARLTARGPGCPFCSGKRVSTAYNFAKINPTAAALWHPTRNGSLRPNQILPRSGRRVWWKCPKGPDHEWEATIDSLTGCPFCCGKRLSVTNRLVNLRPTLALEWHPTKNGRLTPADVTAGSGRKVWWRCPRDARHEWQATVASRVGLGAGCPVCRNLKVISSTSLAARFPKIARQWHPTRNGTLKPSQVAPGSTIKVWWKCPKGPDHEWQSPLHGRTRPSAAGKCPFCVSHRLSVTNTLAARYPEVAAKWHPTLNGSFQPDAVTAHTARSAWWRCNAGPDHEWRANIKDMTGRTLRSGGCPYCSGRKVSITNCLATKYPHIAAEWHSTLNRALSPDGVTAGSARTAWWKCQLGHVYQARIVSRTSRGDGCPVCARRRRRKVATTGARKTQVWMSSYEGSKAGPVVSRRPR